MYDCSIDLKTKLLAKNVKNSLKIKVDITSSIEGGEGGILTFGTGIPICLFGV